MKRTILGLTIACVLAGGIVLGAPSSAKADHRHSSVGVFVGGGGFSVGVGYGSPYRYYGPYRPVPVYAPAPVYAPVVAPSCCHLERVYVEGFWDSWGGWHPGFYRTYRTCDHHGRVLVY
jgi:hypothetical protein